MLITRCACNGLHTDATGVHRRPPYCPVEHAGQHVQSGLEHERGEDDAGGGQPQKRYLPHKGAGEGGLSGMYGSYVSLYVFMCVCVYVCMFVCVYACMISVCMYVWMCVYVTSVCMLVSVNNTTLFIITYLFALESTHGHDDVTMTS